MNRTNKILRCAASSNEVRRWAFTKNHADLPAASKSALFLKGINYVLLCLTITFLTGCRQQQKVILMTGYWPPTNKMLVSFSNDPQLNPDGWIGKNYKGLGYDVYAYFPTFPNGTQQDPKGTGTFQVDYQSTLADFNAVTSTLKPDAIISYGLGAGPWEIETKAINFENWHDDYLAPKQPDVAPPVGNIQANAALPTTLPYDDIVTAVNNACPDINVWIDSDGDPGGFLCNYMCLLGCDYAESQTNRNIITGFIHVGPDVILEQAQKANEATLTAVIEYLNKKAGQ